MGLSTTNIKVNSITTVYLPDLFEAPNNGGRVPLVPSLPHTSRSPPLTLRHSPASRRQDPDQEPPCLHHRRIERHRAGPGPPGRIRGRARLHPRAVARQAPGREAGDPPCHRRRRRDILRRRARLRGRPEGGGGGRADRRVDREPRRVRASGAGEARIG